MHYLNKQKLLAKVCYKTSEKQRHTIDYERHMIGTKIKHQRKQNAVVPRLISPKAGFHTHENGVWTKRGVGHGLPYNLPYGPSYGIPVINFVKTRFSIAVSLCKQRAPSVCHIYDSLPFSWRRFSQTLKTNDSFLKS